MALRNSAVLLGALLVMLPPRGAAQEPALRLDRCERPRAPLGVLKLQGEIAFQLTGSGHPDTASITVIQVGGSSALGMRSAMARLLPACRLRPAASTDGLWLQAPVSLDSIRFEIGDAVVLPARPAASLSTAPDSAPRELGEVVDADDPLVDERPRALKCRMPRPPRGPTAAGPGELMEDYRERGRRQGTVRLSFVVDTTGRASRESIKVRESTQLWANNRAVNLVASCRFAPGRVQGRAVAVRTTWLFYIPD